MLSDWIHWLSSQTLLELLPVVLPLACFDAPRYCLANVAMCLSDSARELTRLLRGKPDVLPDPYTPSVCVILAGLNEADTVGSTLESAWGSYPKMEIIVVDDGSSDGMTEVAREFSKCHSNVLVLRKPNRGGKSSALNFALPFAKAEIVVCVDTDSHLQPGAIQEIVQPFVDSEVAAVAGTVLARNGHVNLVSQLQAAEYLRSIFLGRMLSSRLGILGIVSGAFGAYRREVLLRAGGWDVGPGEDGDLVLRIRKSGGKVVHAPYAQCLTNVPLTWIQLFKQRRRWEWACVTFECRKHIDLANVRSPNFRFSNLALLLETWFFRIGLTFAFFGYLLILPWLNIPSLGFVVFTNYALYLGIELVQWLVLLYYTPNLRRDAWSICCLPIVPIYYFFLKTASMVAILEELVWRRSYQDNFVPSHVRQVTWHW